MEDKAYLSNFSLCKFILELTSHLQLYSAFRQIRGGHRTLPVPVDSQLLLSQNNTYAKVAYFGVPYSDPLHFALLFNCKDQKSSKPHRNKASFCSHEEPPLRFSSKGGSQTQRSHSMWPVFLHSHPFRASKKEAQKRHSKAREEAIKETKLDLRLLRSTPIP